MGNACNAINNPNSEMDYAKHVGIKMRKSDAKDLICPRCNQQTLIKSGFTKSKYGKWQRFQCLNPDCNLITTKPKLNETTREVPIRQGEEVIVIKRGDRGRFAPRNG